MLKQIRHHLPVTGFYIEAGAYDGILLSNTHGLAGWQGILIEPLPHQHAKLKYNRPNTTTYNCCLTATDQEPTEFINCELFSLAKGTRNTPQADADWIEHGRQYQNLQTTETITVPCRTLHNILQEQDIKHVDFLSLDVEGAELKVLQGLNLKINRPRHILIELTHDAIPTFHHIISHGYTAIDIPAKDNWLFVDNT